jgi:type III pantothenate kinase
MIVLAVDIGNTNIKFGLFDKSRLILKEKCTIALKSGCVGILDKVQQEIEVRERRVDYIGVSSVNPALNNLWGTRLEGSFSLPPLFISSYLKLPVKIEIPEPQKLGADRISNAVAGFQLFGCRENVVVIDFGTATTHDVVLKNGSYLGGVIAPGIETSAYALHSRTAKLPLLEKDDFTFPKKVIGKDTRSAMRIGILHSTVYSVDGLLTQIQKELHRKFKVVLTGGLAPLIRSKIKHEAVFKNNLVLYGINEIVIYNVGT